MADSSPNLKTQRLETTSSSTMEIFSALPTELICRILTFLPTKIAVAAAVLSSRFNNPNLWASFTSLDFDDGFYFNPPGTENEPARLETEKDFVRFVDKLLSSQRFAPLSRFRLKFRDSNGNFLPTLVHWITTFLVKHNVGLDIHVTVHKPSYYALTLDLRSIADFPSLLDLQLKFSMYKQCEDLSLLTNVIPKLPRVKKLSLFLVENKCGDTLYMIGGSHVTSVELESHNETAIDLFLIDAPSLEDVSVNDHRMGLLVAFASHEDFVVEYPIHNYLFTPLVGSLPHLLEVKVNVGDCREYLGYYRDVPPGGNSVMVLMDNIVNTRSLKVSAPASLAIVYAIEYRLHMFHCLTRLEITFFPHGGWKLLPEMLERTPNLEFLSLAEEENIEDITLLAGEMLWVEPLLVPSCLLYRLKQLKIKGLQELVEGGFLEYIKQNANVLETITIL